MVKVPLIRLADWLRGSKTIVKGKPSRTYPSFVTGLSHRSPDGLDRAAYLVRLPNRDGS